MWVTASYRLCACSPTDLPDFTRQFGATAIKTEWLRVGVAGLGPLTASSRAYRCLLSGFVGRPAQASSWCRSSDVSAQSFGRQLPGRFLNANLLMRNSARLRRQAPVLSFARRSRQMIPLVDCSVGLFVTYLQPVPCSHTVGQDLGPAGAPTRATTPQPQQHMSGKVARTRCMNCATVCELRIKRNQLALVYTDMLAGWLQCLSQGRFQQLLQYWPLALTC